MQPIHIASAIITDARGRCLLVRKRNTTHFIQPGGKIEAGESPVAALMRELQEELALTPGVDDIDYVGRFNDDAINEPGRQLIAEIYHIHSETTAFQPAAEIEEVIWYSAETHGDVLLAPLTEKHLLPLVKSLLLAE